MTWYALPVFISDKTELETLNFQTRERPFGLARIEWNNVVLNSEASEDRPLVDLSYEDLTQTLIDLFPKLSLVETLELTMEVMEHPRLKTDFNAETFIQSQGMQWNQRLLSLFTWLRQTPLNFRHWAHQKQMGVRDLQPLLGIENPDSVAPLLEKLGQSPLSRNEGKQALDLIVDLILMKVPKESLLEYEDAQWLEALKKQRFPQTLERDAKEKTSTQQWPKYVQVVKHRQGDRLLQKMQITYNDQDDLMEKLSRLQQQGSSS